MRSLHIVIEEAKQNPHVRLGQYFCNTYVQESWPELYNEQDAAKATEMIRDWLSRHCYTFILPGKNDA